MKLDIKIKYPCAEGWDSKKYTGTSHPGIDIGWLKRCSKNGQTPIVACDDGEVVFEGYYPQTINKKLYKPIGVIIKHNWSEQYDIYSIYWHLSRTIINKGDKVKKGQQIGNKGNTGCGSGVHLHFQIIYVDKGAELPDYTKWSKISIDPTDMIEVYDGQIFESYGNYDLAKHVDDDPATTDFKALYNELLVKYNDISATNLTLEKENTSLRDAISKSADILNNV